MSAEIYGDSPASSYLAALLASAKIPVTWYTTGIREVMRPCLLRGQTLGRVRRFLISHGIKVDFLLQAPELEAWGLPGSEAHRFVFDGLGGEMDRWVDCGALSRAFAEASVRSGVIIRQVPVLPSDGGSGSLASFRFADLRWESPSNTDSSRWHFTQLHFSRGGHARVSGSQVALLEGSLGFLEPHPETGHVLTLLSSHRRPIDRALELLGKVRGEGPQLWRLLLLANPGASRVEGFEDCGLSNEGPRDVYAFGAGIGVYTPALNLGVSESLDQAERLLEFTLDPEATVEAWKSLERKRFVACFKRMSLWEKLLVSERFQGNFIELAAWIPRPLRQYLRTPV